MIYSQKSDIIILLNQLNMLKKSFFVSKGVLYPFFGFLHMDLIKMQIPLVESRLALSYSSWFSDLGFAFFVRWLRSAHFLFGGTMSNERKITFFFGAGAEAVFGMPMGAQYTLDTILSERSQMIEALRSFYKGKTNEYSTTYVGQYLFNQDSHTFREIISRAAEALSKKPSDIDEESKKVVDCFNYDPKDKDAERAFFAEVRKVFEYVVIDIDKPSAEGKRPQFISGINVPTKYLSLMEKFSYYGSVEKDFSTIINPKEAGSRRFWRLINYFWSAYFSIIIPVLNLSSKYCGNVEYNKNKYAYILTNLDEIVRYIYSDEFRSEIDKKYQSSYYSKLKRVFPNSTAVTTNYTPFLEFAEFAETMFLAGKLSQFEIPEELRVVEIGGNEDISNRFIFPYMSTQAPLKPIVDCVQLKEYSKLIDTLGNTDILVIIGYNINDNDNHINALLRDFLIRKPTNRIVFSQYVKNGDEFHSKTAISNVAKKLRISTETAKNQITAIPNYGTTDKILSILRG